MELLASKFIKPNVLLGIKKNDSMSKLDTSLTNQRDDMSLGPGPLTRRKSRELLDVGDISQSEIDNYFDGVRKFYVHTYGYCIKRLPLNDIFLQKCVFVDFSRRSEVSVDKGKQRELTKGGGGG